MESARLSKVTDAGVETPAALPMRKVPIDVMRAVSMLYIVGFWHLLDYTKVVGWHYNPITYRLTVGALALFVLISGFLTGRKDGGLAEAKSGASTRRDSGASISPS